MFRVIDTTGNVVREFDTEYEAQCFRQYVCRYDWVIKQC